ncbi:hypothetical protein WN51_02479 [Melipona quadrifasciata]|uniref:Uncharacterized protein n=1 Tax=Melipona quadrifasciata TaxID=166423 RepID=A0A0N0U4I2_9HYME|nr:hypothetical protein WN51_02479 [Melipona quadrifasciata]
MKISDIREKRKRNTEYKTLCSNVFQRFMRLRILSYTKVLASSPHMKSRCAKTSRGTKNFSTSGNVSYNSRTSCKKPLTGKKRLKNSRLIAINTVQTSTSTTLSLVAQEKTQKNQGKVLRKLSRSIKIREIMERIERAKELENLGTIATTEDTRSKLPTATEPDYVTDDESTTNAAGNEPAGRSANILRNNGKKSQDNGRTSHGRNGPCGKDDVGVEEFIKSVKFARSHVNDQDSLLKMTIVQKISGHAKRSVRFCHTSCYDELYEALGSQDSLIPISKAGS